MQKLVDLHPAIFRVPGGNYLEGNDYADRFNWQATIGPVENRPGHMDPWGYWSTDGMGLDEYLQMAELAGAQPLLAVYAGYTLNGSSDTGQTLTDDVTSAINELHYVLDPVTTTWGALRAANGHAAPYNVNYVEVGNEDYNSSYATRYPLFYNAIRAAFPSLKIVATSSGTGGSPFDVLDDHFYNSASWFLSNSTHYDNYTRGSYKVFVGEYASRDGYQTSTMLNALGDAAFLMGMERNSDLVIMSSYAPIWVNVNPGGQQWSTDLIGLNNTTSFGSASYYAQQLLNLHHGAQVVGSSIVGATGLQALVTRTGNTYYLTVVNPGATAVATTVNINGVSNVSSTATAYMLQASSGTATNSISSPTLIYPATSTVTGLAGSYTEAFPAYSLTIVEIDANVVVPTVAVPAAADPAVVTGNTTNLSVLGADAGGESNLTYTWSTTGTPPAAVIFSANGTNAAKNTTATFSKAGAYSLIVTITNASGHSTNSTVNVTVSQTLTGAAITPAVMTVAPGGSTQFAAVGTDQFGDIMAAPLSNVTWSVVSGVGSIDANGLFAAPANGSGVSTIRAVSGGTTCYANVSILSQVAWYPANATSGATLADASGNGKDATLSGAAAFGTGVSGNALALTGGYASLPTGIVSTLNDFTMAAWVKIDTLSTWSRIFDFGTGTTVNMFLTPFSASGAVRFAITTSGNGGEQQINGTSALATGAWLHVAVTLSGNTGTLYVNGAVVGTNTNMTLRPSSLGSTTQNYLGHSQYSADPALLGSIDDFRIIGRALSAAEIQQLVYPAVVTAASASSVTSAAAVLSVLGADATSGESALIYTWSVTGTPPAPVTFSANSANSAKTTTATCTKAGSYNFLVTMTNAAGFSATSSVSLTVNQMLTSIVVSPASASLGSHATQQFAAAAYDQFGAAMSSQPAFNWAVASGVGNINSSTGFYTASFGSGTATITASSGSVTSNTANVTVTDAVPTAATPAAADPGIVTGTTTDLSVLGADSDGGGEAALSYMWSSTGPASVGFSVNSANAAKVTTASFSMAGSYQLTVTITDLGGLSTTSTVNVTVNHTPQSASISPATANITAGGTQQFTLVGQDQFAQADTITDPVSWQLTGQGSLGASSGLYTPPYANGSATVQATYGAFSITAASVTFAGQAQWNAVTSSSWTTSGNWKDVFTSAALAAPGIRGLTGDTILFASAVGPVARLDGANPTLAGITFDNAATSYTIDQGSGGGLTLQGSNGAMVSVLAGSHTISAPVHLASSTLFSQAVASSLTISGPIDGSIGITQMGPGMMTLSGVNSYTGPTQANGGTLVVTKDNVATTFTANSGGTLQFNGATVNSGSRAITSNSGGAVQYVNASINGGALAGSGTQMTLSGGSSSFDGTTINAGTPFTANGPTAFTDVANYGPIAANSTLSWTGGTNASGGSLTVNGILNTSEFTTAGNIAIANGGVLNNSATNLTAYNGAQITVNSGGTLNGDSQNQGVALNLQDCLLVNNGTVTGTTNVNYGATVQGSGTFGQVNVSSGGTMNVMPGLGAAGVTVSGGSIAGSGLLTAPISIPTAAVISTNAGDSLELSGSLTGDGGLTKRGAGAAILSGVGGYAGGTLVGDGTLIVTSAAALPDGSSLTVGAGSYFSAAPLAADAIYHHWPLTGLSARQSASPE